MGHNAYAPVLEDLSLGSIKNMGQHGKLAVKRK